jgi:2EXR family
MIWECTWPDDRLIQPAWHESVSNTDEYCAFTILRPAGPLSTSIKEDLDSGIMKKEPFKYCPDPIALQACKESREHTLKRYRRMEHLEITAGSFYFNPSRDVLFLSMDYIDDQRYSEDLKRLYNGQLNHIRTVLVLDCMWDDTSSAEYIRKFLTIFGSPEVIRLSCLQDRYGDEDERHH